VRYLEDAAKKTFMDYVRLPFYLRNARWIAKRRDLVKLHSAHASFFVQLARGGAVERLVLVDEATGQRPAAAKGIFFSTDQKYGKVVVAYGEHNDIARHRRPRERIGKRHVARDILKASAVN